MKSIPFISVAFIFLVCCSRKPERAPIITIINIGNADRIELGKMIRAVKQYKPRLIAMDFYLVPDSADRDTVLVSELATIDNTVQIVALHDVMNHDDVWDSLETNHPKFEVTNHGFSNLLGDGRFFAKALPLKQTFNTIEVYASSYVVAKNAFGVKQEFLDPDEEAVELEFENIEKNYTRVDRSNLLSGKVNPADIEGKIVLFGYLGKKEDLVWIRGEDQNYNGVEVHAAIIEELSLR